MKYKAIVKDPIDEIKWLIIESDESDTRGFFVYYHTSETSGFDTWHSSLKDAFEVGKVYGINQEDWKIVSNG
ncbi:MAG: hypothetical protein J7497_16050 [Chitinophagaceae bacterium]|nr:hypothetical protein [Chitinophagaceae bacterium]